MNEFNSEINCEVKTEAVPTVNKTDIIRAFRAVGADISDIILIHSSLKSFGYVEGGALSVINAAKQTVGEGGTVVFPTLVQKDFANAYINWDIKKSPSDVGIITETFRLMEGTLRSDQATHSVAAWGGMASALTGEHSAYGPRMGVFGDYCFSYSSPWQKMYMNGAKIIFIGIDMVYNTFKHLAEYMLMEDYCISIKDVNKKCLAMSQIARHNTAGIWPFHDSRKSQAIMEELGLINYTKCGNAVISCIKADDYINVSLRLFKQNPEEWFDKNVLLWIETYINKY